MSDRSLNIGNQLPADVVPDGDCFVEPRVPLKGLQHSPYNMSKTSEDEVDGALVPRGHDWKSHSKYDSGRIDSLICDSGYCPSLEERSFSSFKETGLESCIDKLEISPKSEHDCVSSERLDGPSCETETCEFMGCDEAYASVIDEVSDDQLTAYTQDDEGDSQLHLAIIHGASMAECIIDLAPSHECLNMQNEYRQTPLHLAVLTGQPTIVRKLIICGTSLEMRDRNGNTPLHNACSKGDLECLRALTSPLTEEELCTVPYTLPYRQIPQDFDLKNYEGETCLHAAVSVSQTNLHVVQYLIDQCGADINSMEGKSGRTLLHMAAEMGDVTLVQYLLNHSEIRVDARTYGGQTAILLAFSRGQSHICQMLTDRHADTSQIDNYDSSSDSDDEMEGFMYSDLSICGQPVQPT